MIIPEGFAQITHVYSGANVPTGAVNTYGVLNDDDSSASSLAEALNALWTEFVMPELTDDVTLAKTICKLGPNLDGPVAEFSDPVAGGQPNTSAAPNTAYLVRKNTNFGGRSGRGRMYIPGVAEGSIDDGGAVSNGQITVMNEAFASILDALTPGAHAPVLFHTSDTHSPFTIISFNCDALAATQRRRLRR